jgi:hypothetical protein
MTAALPASAAMLNGGRRVFTEVSDFSEKMAGAGPANLPMMQATAAWQAALGVTEFTLYYGINDRSPDEYRSYCNYVGRLNAILKRARLDPDVLLYYPIRDLMAEYHPVGEPLSLQSQSDRMRSIVESFHRLGGELTRSQIPFCLIDDDNLGDAVIRHGRVKIHQHSFRAIVLPRGVELSEKTKRDLARFEAAGVVVVRDAEPERLTAESLIRILQPQYRLEPASPDVVMGRFLRDKRTVLALVNVGGTRWSGRVTVDKGGAWTLFDPATGSVQAIETESGRVPITLEPLQAVLAASP